MGQRARNRIGVIGAARFLGTHLCDRLLAGGAQIVGQDNLLAGSMDNLALIGDPRFGFRHVDVTDYLYIEGGTPDATKPAAVSS